MKHSGEVAPQLLPLLVTTGILWLSPSTPRSAGRALDPPPGCGFGDTTSREPSRIMEVHVKVPNPSASPHKSRGPEAGRNLWSAQPLYDRPC